MCLKRVIGSGVFPDWRVMDFRLRPGPDPPESQMFKYSPDHLAVIYRTDDPQGTLTFRTDQGIDFINLLNQSCPTFPECLHIHLGFEDAGDGVIAAFLLTFSTGDVAVVSIISHHLLAPVRDMGTHRGQPFQCGEDLEERGRSFKVNSLFESLYGSVLGGEGFVAESNGEGGGAL